MDELLKILTGISPLGLAGLLAFILYTQLKKNKERAEIYDDDGNKIDLLFIWKQIQLIQDNHLHDLPEMNETLKRIETAINRDSDNSVRSFSEIKEGLVYIKARINGRR